jgi:hypothetical protein
VGLGLLWGCLAGQGTLDVPTRLDSTWACEQLIVDAWVACRVNHPLTTTLMDDILATLVAGAEASQPDQACSEVLRVDLRRSQFNGLVRCRWCTLSGYPLLQLAPSWR